METKKTNDSDNKKSKTNHFNVTIVKSRRELYEKIRQHCDDLGCSMSDMTWFAFEQLEKANNYPKHYGLS